jgi:hypothetical protein
LREAVSAAALGPCWTVREQTTITLIKVAGDLLDTAAADVTAARLLDAVDEPRRTVRTFRVEDAALRALPLVLTAASDRTHEEAAQALVRIAATAGDPITLHALARPLRAVRWEVISDEVQRRWKDHAETTLATRGDATNLAAAAVLGLSRAYPTWARDVALTAYEAVGDAVREAVVIDAVDDVPSDVADKILSDASERLARTTERATRGEYAFGGIDDGVLLTATLLRHFDERRFDDLVRFLDHPDVMISDKTPTLDLLADRRDDLPQ